MRSNFDKVQFLVCYTYFQKSKSDTFSDCLMDLALRTISILIDNGHNGHNTTFAFIQVDSDNN
jgi:hypothetical protein